MKSHLRGRIRRTVSAYLEQGAHVDVLALASGDDFLVGFKHENLNVYGIEVRSGFAGVERGLNKVVRKLASKTRQITDLVARHPRNRPPAGTLSPPGQSSSEITDEITGEGKKQPSDPTVRKLFRQAFLPLHRVSRWLDFWIQTRRQIMNLRPDVIASSDFPGLVGASLASAKLGVFHFHDCHELYLESTNLTALERRIFRGVERRFIRRADAVFMVNESIKEEHKRRYSIDGVVIRNCAETAGSESGPSLYALGQIPSGAKIVLYQGGFLKGRGLETLIESTVYLPESTYLVMLGYGPLRAELEQLASDLGVQNLVRFLDAVPPRQLLSTSSTASVGVVPYQPVSLNNNLALPNKVFEYTAVGLPVVVADLPELARIAKTGAGITYDPFDPADLGRAIRKILLPENLSAARTSSTSWGSMNNWETEKERLFDVWRTYLSSDQDSR